MVVGPLGSSMVGPLGGMVGPLGGMVVGPLGGMVGPLGSSMVTPWVVAPCFTVLTHFPLCRMSTGMH